MRDWFPLEKRRRQSGLLRKFLTPEQIAALAEAVEAPLSEREQRILEGDGTDETGLWVGLAEDRDEE